MKKLSKRLNAISEPIASAPATTNMSISILIVPVQPAPLSERARMK